MLIIGFDFGIKRSEFEEDAVPEVVGEGEDVGLGDEGDATAESLFFRGDGKPREGAGPGALASEFQSVADDTFDTWAGIDGGLDGDFLGRTLACEATRADVEVLIIFTDDHHVDLIGALVTERSADAGIELDGAEIDIETQLKTEAEEQALFEDAGRDAGITDCAEEDGIGLAEVGEHAIGEDLASFQVEGRPEGERRGLNRDLVRGGDVGKDGESILDNLGAHTVTRDDRDRKHRRNDSGVRGGVQDASLGLVPGGEQGVRGREAGAWRWPGIPVR
jgi:hypothetical protein